MAAALFIVCLASSLCRWTPLIQKVPTYQLFRAGECLVQVPGRGEAHDCRRKLHEAIRQHVPWRNAKNRGSVAQPVQEIANEEALQQIFEAVPETVLAIEWYGKNCKQCARFSPMYESLPYAYRDCDVIFFRADATSFPSLIAPPPDPLTYASLDRSAGIDKRLEGCPRCGGSGFVKCPACGSKGHVLRMIGEYTVADVCTACVGNRKVPCPQCGGKCYLC